MSSPIGSAGRVGSQQGITPFSPQAVAPSNPFGTQPATSASSTTATGQSQGVQATATTTSGQGSQGTTASTQGLSPQIATTATANTSSTSSTSPQDATGTDTFLKLLVAQLQNQDPTSPMDDQSFVTELAQFNTVEQMLGLKQAVTAQVNTQTTVEAVGMLGRTVTYASPGLGGGPVTTNQGVVTGVSLVQGQAQLQIGTQQVPLSEVTAVQ